MKTYIFKVVIEPDEDRWSAYCPVLEHLGAATWGNTPEEALKHINEVVQMIVKELIEDGEPIPEDIQVSQDPRNQRPATECQAATFISKLGFV